jgi:uncharacterized protein (DUF3820 family)
MKTETSPRQAPRFSPYKVKREPAQATPIVSGSPDSDDEEPVPYIPELSPSLEPGPYVLDFGKHRGKTLEQVEREAPSYIAWLIRENVGRSRPDLQEALDLHKSSCQEASSSSPTASGGGSSRAGSDYVMPFGKHMGKKLSTLPPSYLDWLSDSISSGGFPTHPELKTALQSIGISHAPSITSLNPHWTAPSIHLAPSDFYDWMSQEPLWITDSDARKYFEVGRELFAELPRAYGGEFDLFTGAPNPFATARERERVWLVHVWDVVRTHKSRGVADEALGRFLEKNKRREQEIFDEMGLGVLVE